MVWLPQILFILLAGGAVFLFTKNILKIRRNILLGKDEDLSDRKPERFKNLVLIALGQKKMFRNPTVAIMHFLIYAGFIIINIEVLEIGLDGIFGTHRMFLGPLGTFYTFVIDFFEILALSVLSVCIVFLIRRNVLKLKRFISKDLDGWPRSDANYILITEIILMTLFLIMNATDRALQLQGAPHYRETGDFLISGLLAPMFANFSTASLIIIERVCWWLHIIGIFAFLNYLPYSKHLHILFAFPNSWFTRLQPKGKMENMPAVQNEVLYMMEPEKAPTEAAAAVSKFGAKDVPDLKWKNLLDAYTCTECGRCTSACPANITGKLLSPRKIMMDTRDRATEIGKIMDSKGSFEGDGKTLVRDYISVEELRACTSCNACVEECPVNINPLEIILELRRGLVMEDSDAPPEWNMMFSNIETNYAPWKLSPEERAAWIHES